MPYSLSFIFLLLYLLMCHVLPLKATLAQWDLILEPIAQVALKEPSEQQQMREAENYSMEPLVLERLKDILCQKYHLNGKVVLTPVAHWNVTIPEGSWDIELINAPQRLSQTTSFNIRIVRNNRVLASNRNWVLQVENRVVCLCARHNLVPQIVVDFREFRTEERNLLNMAKQPFPIDIEGTFRLKHRLSAGDVLFEDGVEKQALIHKGSSVDVFIKKGYLTLNLKGIALDSGDLNEIILVKNTSSNKTFRGRIIDANTVQVAF